MLRPVPDPKPRTAHWGGPWGARDRSKAEAFAKLVNDAIERWEQQAGVKRTPSDLSYDIGVALGHSYQITQVRRVRAGERATFDDPALIDAWCEAVPTLDRAEAFATVGLLPPGMTAAQLRKALTTARRPGRRAVAAAALADQQESNTMKYVSGAGRQRYTGRTSLPKPA